MSDSTRGRDLVAVILAVGLTLSLAMLMFGVVWDAVRSDTPGLSENATQVIIAGFGGIIGVLGGYVGARTAERRARRDAGPPASGSTPPAADPDAGSPSRPAD